LADRIGLNAWETTRVVFASTDLGELVLLIMLPDMISATAATTRVRISACEGMVQFEGERGGWKPHAQHESQFA